jgi:hypothetical protein
MNDERDDFVHRSSFQKPNPRYRRNDRFAGFTRKEPRLDDASELSKARCDVGDVLIVRHPDVDELVAFVGDARLAIARAEHGGEIHGGESALQDLAGERRDLDGKDADAEPLDEFRSRSNAPPRPLISRSCESISSAPSMARSSGAISTSA